MNKRKKSKRTYLLWLKTEDIMSVARGGCGIIIKGKMMNLEIRRGHKTVLLQEI